MKDFAFGKENYILLAVAVLFITVGFLLMSGGGTGNETFDPAIFSARRIVVAPVVTVIGFALVVYGIIRKPKDTDDNTAENN